MINEKTFRYLNLTIATWAFVSLLLSGSVALLPIIIGVTFLLAAFIQFKFLQKIPNNLWTILTLLCFLSCIYYARVFVMLDAMILFFVFVMGIKICSLRRNRDFFHLYTITFFIMLLSVILTPSIFVAVTIIGYIFLLIINLIYFNVKCDFDRAIKSAEKNLLPSPDVDKNKKLPIYILVSVLTIFIILLTAFFFTFIPRFPTQVLQGIGGFKIQRLSGFSDEVNFMNPGSIQTDETVVMRVKPLIGGNDFRSLIPFYLRGTSLANYTGRKWERGKSPFSDSYNIEMEGVNVSQQFYNNDKRLFQKVILEPKGQSYLFGATFPFRMRFISPRNVEINDDSGSIKLSKPNDVPFIYDVVSLIEPKIKFDPEESQNEEHYTATSKRRGNRGVSWIADWRIRFFNLQLPGNMDVNKYKSLGETITVNKTTIMQKAAAIENYFINNYKYSLEGTNEIAQDHLDNFIFKDRKGHCEYFATAMIVILRSMGIPSRIAVGYCTDEWNPIGRYFTVREQHAHTWVEVWIDKYGWMSFDPTPPAGIASGRMGPLNIGAFYNIVDSLKFMWYRYVLDYSAEDQKNLRNYIKKGTSGINLKFSQLFSDFIRSIGVRIPENQTLNLKMIFLFVALFAIFLVILFYLLKELRIIKPKKNFINNLQTHKKISTIQFFKDLLKLLKKHGYTKSIGETPAEFAARIANEIPSLKPLFLLISYYYKIRYSNEQLTKEEYSEVMSIFNQTKMILKNEINLHKLYK